MSIGAGTPGVQVEGSGDGGGPLPPGAYAGAWIWSPDGKVPVGDGVFADFNLLWAAIIASGFAGQVLLQIVVDDTGYLVIPVRTGGTPYDFESRIKFVNASPGLWVYPQFADGAKAINMKTVGVGVYVCSKSATVPALTWVAGGPDLLVEGGGGIYQESGAGVALHVATGTLFVSLKDSEVGSDDLTPVISIAAGATLELSLAGVSGFYDNAISGPVGSTLKLSASADSYPSLVLPNFLGTLQRSNDAHAPQIDYTPATPANWSAVPAQVDAALNTLASNKLSKTIAGQIAAMTPKAVPAAADVVMLNDSAAANAVKQTTAAAIAALAGRGLKQVVIKSLATDETTSDTAQPPTDILLQENITIASVASVLLVIFSGNYFSVGAVAMTTRFTLWIDGVAEYTQAMDNYNFECNGMVMFAVKTGLAVGARNVKVTWGVDSGAKTARCDAGTAPNFRGARFWLLEL